VTSVDPFITKTLNAQHFVVHPGDERGERVRILVDGQPGESLGHLDLSEPFAPVKSLLPEKSEPKS
jgi:hypothetical protein